MNRIFSRPLRLATGLFLCVLVLAAGCSQEPATKSDTGDKSEPAMHVAVVDESRVFNESNAGLEGVKMLNELNKSLREQLTAMQTKAQNGTDQDVAGFRGAVQQYQDIMNNQQRALYDAVQEKYVSVLTKYREDHGIAVVFGQENAVSFDPDVDITTQVIEALNAAKVELPEIDPATFDLTPKPAAEEAPAAQESSMEETAPENATAAPAAEAPEAPAAENASGANATGANATE